MTSIDRCTAAAPAAARVRELTERFRSAWWDCPTPPDLGRLYTPDQQMENEERLLAFEERARREMAALRRAQEGPGDSAHADEDGNNGPRQRLLAAFRSLVWTGLGFDTDAFDEMVSAGLPQMAEVFAQTARTFDPALAGEEIFQAVRNVWTMHFFQLLLGKPLQMTPSIFAYSLLYPYTDNLLDAPGQSTEQTEAFSKRLADRIAGEEVTPEDRRERQVYALVGLIEEEYARHENPAVFESLMSIHSAQTRSAQLSSPLATPFARDILGIEIEKGGTSVVADAHLVQPRITPQQQVFAFGWGVFAQFVDDLQDVREDAESGLNTIFSAGVGRWPLDAVTDRALAFGQAVLDGGANLSVSYAFRGLDAFSAAEGLSVKRLMRQVSSRVVIEAAGLASDLYSDPYIERLERHSPFRFRFLRQRRARAGDRFHSLTQMADRLASMTDRAFAPPFPIPPME